MKEFNLTYKQLKEKAGIKEGEIGDGTIHRWIQLGLIPCEKTYHSRYSKESVEYLSLCIKLRSYGKNIHEMKKLFESYSLKILSKKIGKITPDDLNEMINRKN